MLTLRMVVLVHRERGRGRQRLHARNRRKKQSQRRESHTAYTHGHCGAKAELRRDPPAQYCTDGPENRRQQVDARIDAAKYVIGRDGLSQTRFQDLEHDPETIPELRTDEKPPLPSTSIAFHDGFSYDTDYEYVDTPLSNHVMLFLVVASTHHFCSSIPHRGGLL
jgi:hypothetical protein